jgi:hypothetical protein
MPFGLCNAPATFFTLMNDMLRSFLDQFVVVYLDEIIVYYNESMEEKNKHLAQVFEALQQNQLFLKKSKCVFVHTDISFSGNSIDQECIHMDPMKVKEIKYLDDP